MNFPSATNQPPNSEYLINMFFYNFFSNMFPPNSEPPNFFQDPNFAQNNFFPPQPPMQSNMKIDPNLL